MLTVVVGFGPAARPIWQLARARHAKHAIDAIGIFTIRLIVGIIDAMPRDDAERVIIPLSRRLLDRIEDFRYGHRIPSRAAAIRRLIETGLKHEKPPEPKNSKR